MKKLVVVLALLAALVIPVAAQAHPLGNFTINRYSRIEPSGNRLYILYVLDMAEIPTFQARPEVSAEGEAAYAASLSRSIAKGIELTIGGKPVTLEPIEHVLAFPPGQAGLRTTRLEVVLSSPRLAPGGTGPGLSVVYRDRNYADRIGWKEIVTKSGSGASVLEASAPSTSVSHELLSYPKDLLSSPLDVTDTTATIRPGSGPGSPPTLIPRTVFEQRVGVRAVSDGGFAALISQGHLSFLVIFTSLGVAFFWGLVHALSPGHGKTIITAYLVGQRGAPRHAFYLGLITTVTHTIGVFTLGAVTLLLSSFIVPDQLYPWLNLVSGVLVVLIGASALTLRFRNRNSILGHGHSHDHDHLHSHGGKAHSHAPPAEMSWRSLVAVGVSGGLIPCPSALVVLLAAISLHRVGFGLLLILAFSVGLALTITGIGLVAVLAKQLFNRVSFEGRVVRLLPAASALVIVVAGVLMTAKALPKLN